MWKKIILGVVIVLLLGVGLAWLNRGSVILFIATHSGKQDVAENRQIDWQQGPAEASIPADARPPNVVFILADDLGYNDISTFGGGVAGGAVRTPNIDRLAREGVIFTNAYAGTASCAPSRAMLMTGRYPTRTGFEFTPTRMGWAVSFQAFRERRVKAARQSSGIRPQPKLRRPSASKACRAQKSPLPKFSARPTTTPYTLASGIWDVGRNLGRMRKGLMKAC